MQRRSAAPCGSCGAPTTGSCPAVGRARFLNDWLPHADWVELDGIGHCPQLDGRLETAQLILGFTSLSGLNPSLVLRKHGAVQTE
jgi:pimeloyl-ACP methyl ester carboxylesterase